MALLDHPFNFKTLLYKINKDKILPLSGSSLSAS
jgi:hypothetical protein